MPKNVRRNRKRQKVFERFLIKNGINCHKISYRTQFFIIFITTNIIYVCPHQRWKLEFKSSYWAFLRAHLAFFFCSVIVLVCDVITIWENAPVIILIYSAVIMIRNATMSFVLEDECRVACSNTHNS